MLEAAAVQAHELGQVGRVIVLLQELQEKPEAGSTTGTVRDGATRAHVPGRRPGCCPEPCRHQRLSGCSGPSGPKASLRGAPPPRAAVAPDRRPASSGGSGEAPPLWTGAATSVASKRRARVQEADALTEVEVLVDVVVNGVGSRGSHQRAAVSAVAVEPAAWKQSLRDSERQNESTSETGPKQRFRLRAFGAFPPGFSADCYIVLLLVRIC